MQINLFKYIRRKLVQKLIRPEDGYTFTGFCKGEPLKFYYQEDTGKYLLGMRAGNMCYFEPTLSSWSSVSSRYLPWGETVEGCVFNPVTKKWMLIHTTKSQRKLILKNGFLVFKIIFMNFINQHYFQ